jgi:hypothetical protein
MTDTQPTSHGDRVEVERAKRAPSASRSARERVEREAGARRALFVASIAGLIAASGVVAVSHRPLQAPDEGRPSLVGEANTARRVVAEVPILSADGEGVETVIRFIAPEPDTAAPHVRTRATP